MSTPILEVRDLHVGYGKVEALHGASLTVAPGQIVTVIGPNGAGKSTILIAIAITGASSLPAASASRGQVVLNGGDLAGVAIESRVARGMCLVPEKRELFATMTVEDNLQLGSYRRYKAGERNYGDQLDEVYRLFPRLKERRKQDAGTLSGGERQMLAVGRALMAKPRLLMLDEPTEGIQPSIIKDIGRVLQRVAREGLHGEPMAIVLVEQYFDFAAELADRYLVMERGEIIARGRGAQLEADGVRALVSI